MPYRISANGTLETDTAQEALDFLTLCAKTDIKVFKTQFEVKSAPKPVLKPKGITEDALQLLCQHSRGHEAIQKTRKARKVRGSGVEPSVRRPALAVQHGVKSGQVWEKRWAQNPKHPRLIKVSELQAKGLMPKILKNGGSKRKGHAGFLTYEHLLHGYKLVKDV